MESSLKQRLIGAAVLAALAIIFLPMLLKGPDVKAPDAAEVPLTMPASPDQKFETHELPLSAPDTATPPGGVLGMDTAPPATTPVPAGTDTLPTPDTTVVTPPATTAPATTPAVTPAITPPKPETAVVTPPKPLPATTPVPPKPVVTPPPAAPAAVAGGNYSVTIGTFSNLDNANALVARLRAAKLPVNTDKVDVGGKPALRVRVGPYADRATAEAARLRADGIAGGSSKVVTLDGAAAKPVATPATPAPKPATPAAPAASKPTSNVGTGFAVQLAAPSVEAEAIALRDRARAQGFSAFVQRVDTDAGARYRVRVGPVADRPAAEALRDSVNQKLGASGIVVPNP
ncbi:SPOR domain-containing protein [Arenimonas oryziterrae]|uniref:SPOR domain-containing protein n=1 Tax=Arenimonas oryziterrae DSM 21050 = YC6267 TaxID=1121015 RepID=A0A091B1X6_9GAMM|nr:SPOR domain-containing protein [Arenimonas oryziterrae]KFN44899.1 hypothetical protein N789_02450 [Arenimonas oryziterrae DSM 21050 = YC6267]